MFNDALAAQALAALVQTLLSGGAPNGAPPEAYRENRDIAEALVQAYASGGTTKVCEVWAGMVRRHPEYAALASEDALQSEGWQVYTLADAYQPRPPVEYVVEGLFPLPSLSIVYGAAGTLKSLLLADLAICTAASLSWLSPLPGASIRARQTQQVMALWCDFDNGARMTHERLAALARARDLAATIPFRYVSMPAPWLDASSFKGMQPLAACMQTQRAKLVILDNLLMIKGRVDENSAEMGTVMANLRRLAEEGGAAIVVIHHQRKDTGVNSRAGDRIRGHSSIEAALDLALLVEREHQSDALTLCSTKERGVTVPPFGAQFAYEHTPGTTELATARFYGPAVEDKVSDRAIEEAITASVKAHPLINQKELKQHVKETLPKVGMHRIGGVISRLEQRKKLKVTTGERGAKLYEEA
jgi:AAA domain